MNSGRRIQVSANHRELIETRMTLLKSQLLTLNAKLKRSPNEEEKTRLKGQQVAIQREVDNSLHLVMNRITEESLVAKLEN